MKKFPWGKCVLLLIMAAVLGYGYLSVREVGGQQQYLVKAPALQESQDTSGETNGESKTLPNQGIKDAKKKLTTAMDALTDNVSAWTMNGVIDETSLQGDSGGGAAARLTLLGENALTLQPKYLRYGRLLSPEELKNGDKVILLDEQLALAVFNISDPLERKVTVLGESYRVVGILRHTKQVGDLQDYGAYIPLTSCYEQAVQLDALEVIAEPIKGTGASVALKNALTGWMEGGSYIDLGKEGMGAWLWLRVLLFLMGATLVLRAVSALNRMVREAVRDGKIRLERAYAVRLMPRFTLRAVMLALGYVLCALLLAWLMQFIIEPVYTFTEWVPAVLVEWEEIGKAFWLVWQTNATMTALRTPELMRLQFLTVIIDMAAACAGLLLAVLYGGWHAEGEKRAAALKTQYAMGIMVSKILTTKPSAMKDLGYVPCDASRGVHADGKGRRAKHMRAMLRVIDAEAVLRALPNTQVFGSFIVEVTDPVIRRNNGKYWINCDENGKTVTAADKGCDLILSISALTELVYGNRTFRDYLENGEGFELIQRIPTMDGLFGHHLTVDDPPAEQEEMAEKK